MRPGYPVGCFLLIRSLGVCNSLINPMRRISFCLPISITNKKGNLAGNLLKLNQHTDKTCSSVTGRLPGIEPCPLQLCIKCPTSINVLNGRGYSSDSWHKPQCGTLYEARSSRNGCWCNKCRKPFSCLSLYINLVSSCTGNSGSGFTPNIDFPEPPVNVPAG